MLFKLYVMITHKHKIEFSKSYMKPTAEVDIIVGTNFRRFCNFHENEFSQNFPFRAHSQKLKTKKIIYQICLTLKSGILRLNQD